MFEMMAVLDMFACWVAMYGLVHCGGCFFEEVFELAAPCALPASDNICFLMLRAWAWGDFAETSCPGGAMPCGVVIIECESYGIYC